MNDFNTKVKDFVFKCLEKTKIAIRSNGSILCIYAPRAWHFPVKELIYKTEIKQGRCNELKSLDDNYLAITAEGKFTGERACLVWKIDDIFCR